MNLISRVVSGPSDSPEEVRAFRRTLAKFLTVVAGCLTCGVLVVGSLGSPGVGKTDTFRADFGDVSGLVSGDPVRVAGVSVGIVTKVRLRSANTVEVTFTANRNQAVTTTTHAAIRYANLLGQRYLALTHSGEVGTQLPNRSTIPRTQTTPAVSLTELLNGFQPVFESFNPEKANALMESLVQVLQGRTDKIGDIVAQTAELASSMSERSDVIVRVVENLTTVVQTVARHDDEFAKTLVDLRELTAMLADDSSTIARTIETSSDLAASSDKLLGDLRTAGLGDLARATDQVAGKVADGSKDLQAAVDSFGPVFENLARTSQSGSWANGYPCIASVSTVGDPRLSGGDVATALGIFLGIQDALQKLSDVLGLDAAGAELPIEVPQGRVGAQGNQSVACR